MNVLRILEDAALVGVFFHSDGDGVCSAAMLLKVLREAGRKYTLACGEYGDHFEKFYEKRGEVNFFLDIAVPSPDAVSGFPKPVVVDHHPVSVKDWNGVVYVNPRLEDPKAYISTSQVLFDLLGKPDLRWLMRLGAVSDRALKPEGREAEGAEVIEAVRFFEKETGLVKLAKFLSNCSGLQDLLDSKYSETASRFRSELREEVKRFEIYMKDVTFFETEKKNMTSILASRLLDLYPDKTIIVYARSDGFYKISGRSRKHDMGFVFSEAAKGIGTGGGHENAAGAKIPVGEFSRFRKRVERLLSSQ